MAKKIQGYIRLQLPAGAANPAPPVGPALGAQGVNIMAFCKEFNAKTKDQNGMILPVDHHGLLGQELHVHPEVAAGLGAPQEGRQHRQRLGASPTRTRSARSPASSCSRSQAQAEGPQRQSTRPGIRIIAGTARNMGIEVVD